MIVKKIVLLLCLLYVSLLAEYDYSIENSNFTLSQGDKYTYNYNRARLNVSYYGGNFFTTFIGDAITYYGEKYVTSNEFIFYQNHNYSDTPFRTKSTLSTHGSMALYTQLYRAYIGYEDSSKRIVVGVQNIPMGVGHIFNPTNMYNPKNIYMLEPDEILGVSALSYTAFLNSTANVNIILSQRKDNTYEFALRYKAYLKYADFGIEVISGEDLKMIAYETEGDLLDTGIQLRSEAAYVQATLHDGVKEYNKVFIQAMLGGDYGFENGISVTMELLYSTKTFSSQEILLNLDSQVAQNFVGAHFYAGLSCSYDINIFLNGSFVYIKNSADHNLDFLSPMLTYTLNDYNSFSVGALLDNSQNRATLGGYDEVYYFKYLLSF